MRALLLISLWLSCSFAFAQDRELASKGNEVRLTISNSFKCSPETTVNIQATSADYFDKDAITIQRLVNTASAVLGFECPSISKLHFIGMTDSTLVFKAEAKKLNKWALESEPPPLEALSLFFSLYKPDFVYLGIANQQLQKYKNVTGIKNSFQFKVFEKQIQRIAAIANGDADQFSIYMKENGNNFTSFEDAQEHYQNILDIIEIYAPEHYPAYKSLYSMQAKTLKDDFWESHIQTLFSKEDKTVEEIIVDARALIKTSPSPEFSDYVDSHISAWISEEAEIIQDDVDSAPLFEMAWVSEFVAGFPDQSNITDFPKTKSTIAAIGDDLATKTSERIEALVSMAQELIQDSGNSYDEANTILETGFALAGEFEDAGYNDEGEALLAFTFTHIENILKSDLPNYQQEIQALELTPENVSALQEQVFSFQELSKEFQGFSAYQQATEKALAANKGGICEGLLKNAGASSTDFKKLIHIGDSHSSLSDLACSFYENNHTISEFSSNWTSTEYTLEITQSDGEQKRFLLVSDELIFGQNLRATKQIDEQGAEIHDGDWKNYIAGLTEPPPSGIPDANGVRECDRLGADPHDPKKLAGGIDLASPDLNPEIFDRAIDACIAAVENSPEDTRQQFQLGRLLWHAGDQETASEYINLAASDNYAAALYYRAEILLATSSDSDAFIDALNMFKAAGKAGYARGNDMVKQLNPDGIDFYKEIPPPTGKDIVNSLADRGRVVAMWGVTASIKIVGADINECFQTSATDFSCEYRKIAECNMGGGGNNPMMGLLNAAFQADCRSAGYQFGSFRKVSEGKWRELPNQF